jgi:hypothetical protein
MELENENFKGRIKMNNGGMGGSGIFGMIGTTVQCHASDNSYYCNFMKLIQVVMWISIILFIIYFFFPSIFTWKLKRQK